MAFVVEHKAVILGALLAISEVLALIPSVKASGIFDAAVKLVQYLMK